MARKYAFPIVTSLLALMLSFVSTAHAQHWDTTFSYRGFDRYVSTLAWKGDTLFAAGDFFTAGGRKAYGVAYRIGDKWIPLPNGVDEYGYIYTLKIIGDQLYLGGEFGSVNGQTAGSIARYDLNAQQWSMMQGGVATSHFRPKVNDLEYDGRYLYVAGEFDTAGGSTIAHDLARWDTREERWSSVVDIVGEETEVFDLMLRGDTLYVGGTFRDVSGVATNGLVTIDLADHSVTSLSDDLISFYSSRDVSIHSLARMNGELYAGGRIDSIVSVTRVSNIVRLYDGKWLPLGEGVWPGVYQLAVYKDHLLTYGHSEAGFEGIDGYYFAYWDGQTWHYPSDHYLPSYFLITGDELIAAGAFWIDSNYGHRIARFNASDSSWIPLDDNRTGGPKSSVYEMVAIKDQVFISGHHVKNYTDDEYDFLTTVEQWDGVMWRTLFEEPGYDEQMLATDGKRLYTFGAGHWLANDRYGFALRSYDPENGVWSLLDSVILTGHWISKYVVRGTQALSLTYADGSLFLGGSFDSLNGISCNNIARFDPGSKTWSSLGSGIPIFDYGAILALSSWRNLIIAGGEFDTLGLKNLAAFDPATNTWHPVGSCDSITGRVISLETYNNDLIVGGYFREVCDKPAGFIASWNGSEWNPLNGGFDENWYMTSIEDLHANGDDLYASGFFFSAGGDTVNHIARWDGAKWHAVDEASSDHDKGTNERVNAVVTVGNDVFIGGYFSTAGDIASDKFAEWLSGKSNVISSRTTQEASLLLSNPVRGSIEIVFPHEASWSVEIYNVLGIQVMPGVVLRGGRGALRLLDPLPRGTYVLRARSGDEVLSARFMKE